MTKHPALPDRSETRHTTEMGATSTSIPDGGAYQVAPTTIDHYVCMTSNFSHDQEAASPSNPSKKSSIDPEQACRHPLRILLAEDNLLNQKVVVSLLRRMGYEIDIVFNGREALAALDQQIYDVVLMDIQMPEMDGLEATRSIRAQLPDAHQPWIIALTAQAMEGDRERFLSSGMNDYVSKPIRIEALADALKKVKS